MSRARLVVCVLLPFAAGYYLSYLFRSINAVIASDLTADLGLSAADLGFLTSVYFLVIAAAQLPLGALLDRHGPAAIQSPLLLLASAGALVFASADSLLGLVIGRALLGLGVSLALMAGFKAIILWFPPGRVALANGWLVMLGALGALTATAPAEMIVQSIGWRGLFAVAAALTALAALFVLFVVPEQRLSRSTQRTTSTPSVWTVYRDRRFWRMAPLSAAGIGTSWSLQGLWAAPWLRDVDGLDRASVVQHLSAMAIVVCAAALLLGVIADRLRRVGIKTEVLLVATLGASAVAQYALVAQWPVPSIVVWAVIAAAGAATVLSFAILREYFPKEISGRANAALNLLHVGGAFVLQSATGAIIAVWPQEQGIYPAEAHQAAMGAILLVQVAAIAWFVSSGQITAQMSARRARASVSRSLEWWTLPARRPAIAGYRSQHVYFLCQQRAQWRLAATASSALCVGLIGVVFNVMSPPAVAIHMLDTDTPKHQAVDAQMVDWSHHSDVGKGGGVSASTHGLRPTSWGGPPERWHALTRADFTVGTRARTSTRIDKTRRSVILPRPLGHRDILLGAARGALPRETKKTSE